MQHRVLSVGSDLAHADFRGAAQHSFDVQPCATLSLALDRAARASFECILVSSHLPDAPGTEAVQRLRRECGDTPLLFVSDTPDVDFREWGADEVFTSHEVGTRLFARSLLYAIEQRRVRVQHRQLERLLETIPDAILVTNRRGKVRYVNPAALELFGCARLDLEEELLAFAAKDREPFEINVLRKGDIRTCEMRVVDIEWDNEPAQLGTIRDVTDRHRAEELRARGAKLEQESLRAQEANRLKSEFLANMSHELRTPLNAIIGFSELLARGKVQQGTPRYREYLGYITSGGQHLLTLINDLLDLAKIEGGKIELRAQKLDLSQVVRDVVEVTSSIALRKSIQVQMELDPGVGIVELDSARLKQVIYNYLSNAIKFSEANGRVVIRTRALPDDMFRIEVEDAGPGIASEDLGRLFVQFEQLESGANKKHQGTGLGLAITRRVVEAQGGSVGVVSEPGMGSTFFALMPRHMRAKG